MAIVKELIRTEDNGTLSFGDYSLDKKTKLSDYEYQSNIYKVKTFCEITRLEKNGRVAYESVPGSAVFHYIDTGKEISFEVEAKDDLQITVEVEPESEVKVLVDDMNIGRMKSNLGGKVSFSIEMEADEPVKVQIKRI